MADRPILYSAPMVRAILSGRKTQTRRIIKRQPLADVDFALKTHDHTGHKGRQWGWMSGDPEQVETIVGRDLFNVRHAKGDRLWVRETWFIATKYSYGTTPGGCEINPPPLGHRSGDPVHYGADGNPPNCANKHYGPDGLRGGWFAAPDPYATWDKKPAIHMPRWASRLTQIVTDVRVERLHDITEADATAEGVYRGKHSGRFADDYVTMALAGEWFASARAWYRNLWDRINGPGAWDANPWVTVTSFASHQCNIDHMETPNVST